MTITRLRRAHARTPMTVVLPSQRRCVPLPDLPGSQVDAAETALRGFERSVADRVVGKELADCLVRLDYYRDRLLLDAVALEFLIVLHAWSRLTARSSTRGVAA